MLVVSNNNDRHLDAQHAIHAPVEDGQCQHEKIFRSQKGKKLRGQSWPGTQPLKGNDEPHPEIQYGLHVPSARIDGLVLFIVHSKHESRPRTFVGFAFCSHPHFILLSASEGLYTTQWAPGLGTAILLAAAGVVLGLALGFSQFKRAAVIWFSFGYSLPIVILVLGWILYSGISWMERVADLSSRLAPFAGLVFYIPAGA